MAQETMSNMCDFEACPLKEYTFKYMDPRFPMRQTMRLWSYSDNPQLKLVDFIGARGISGPHGEWQVSGSHIFVAFNARGKGYDTTRLCFRPAKGNEDEWRVTDKWCAERQTYWGERFQIMVELEGIKPMMLPIQDGLWLKVEGVVQHVTSGQKFVSIFSTLDFEVRSDNTTFGQVKRSYCNRIADGVYNYEPRDFQVTVDGIRVSHQQKIKCVGFIKYGSKLRIEQLQRVDLRTIQAQPMPCKASAKTKTSGEEIATTETSGEEISKTKTSEDEVSQAAEWQFVSSSSGVPLV